MLRFFQEINYPYQQSIPNYTVYMIQETYSIHVDNSKADKADTKRKQVV